MTIESISKILHHQTTFEAAQKHEDQDQQEAYFFASQTWVSDSWHFEIMTCNGGTCNCWLNNFKNSCKNWKCHRTRVQHNRRIICWKSLSPKSYAEVFNCVHPFLDHAFQHLSGVTGTLASAKGQLKTQMLEILNLFLYYVVLTYYRHYHVWTDVPASVLGRMSRPSTTNFLTLSLMWVWLWYILIGMGLSAFFFNFHNILMNCAPLFLKQTIRWNIIREY